MKTRVACADLEAPVLQVELCLTELHEALKSGDIAALEDRAAALHRTLTAAVTHFSAAAKQGGVPTPLRERLARASARVASQRLALARATASLDRAIDVLMPSRPTTYGATGHGARYSSGATLMA